MTTAQTDMIELTSIKTEIKRISETLKTLRKKEKEIELKLTEYLTSTDQQGFKYNGSAVILTETTPCSRKKKKDSEADMMAVLQRYGTTDPETTMRELERARKGTPVIKHKIKFEKLSKQK
jgi:hypothetical protein